MRVLLTSREHDFDPELPPPPNADDLIQDLELETVVAAMSGGDRFLGGIARAALLHPLSDLDAIAYRQAALRDCISHSDVITELYGITLAALQAERRHWTPMNSTPQSILSRSHAVMSEFVDVLARLRTVGNEHRDGFESAAFRRLFEMLATELDDDYLQVVRDQLALLAPDRGSLASTRLGAGNKGVDHVLREPDPESWLERVSPFHRRGYGFEIAERDHSGVRALSELADRALNPAANALAQSVEHIVAFLKALLTELALYVGAVNLHEQLLGRGVPVCMPVPDRAETQTLSAAGLIDVPLALTLDAQVVGNDLEADGCQLIVITGANGGGKSTLLRALGVAQLMMQCGLFVGAEQFSAGVRDGVFTHHPHEEDASMTSGRLVEELKRMSELVDHIGPTGLMLCNESFASTNEREGSEIGLQVIAALIEAGVRVVYVTHQYELARRLLLADGDRTLFLRADLAAGGERTFRLTPGDPLATSHGLDTYRQIFAASG